MRAARSASWRMVSRPWRMVSFAGFFDRRSAHVRIDAERIVQLVRDAGDGLADAAIFSAWRSW